MLDNNTYVDNLTIAADTITEVFAICEEITRLLGEGSFRVKKWASNSQALLKKLDPSTLAPTEIDLHPMLNNIISSDTSTLGVQWEPRTDLIHYAQFSWGAKDDDNTMCSVASLLARTFDPIGLLSPFASKNGHERISLAWYEMDQHSSTRIAAKVEEVGGAVAMPGNRALPKHWGITYG